MIETFNVILTDGEPIDIIVTAEWETSLRFVNADYDLAGLNESQIDEIELLIKSKKNEWLQCMESDYEGEPEHFGIEEFSTEFIEE
jgi:hypothetical protein